MDVSGTDVQRVGYPFRKPIESFGKGSSERIETETSSNDARLRTSAGVFSNFMSVGFAKTRVEFQGR